MKKTFIILIILLSNYVQGQNHFEIEEKTVVGVFEVENKSKEDIFTSINKWIVQNLNSEKSVQMNDLETGNILIKVPYPISWENPYPKVAYKKNTYYRMNDHEKKYVFINHLIEINIKENRYKITDKIENIIDLTNNVFNGLFKNNRIEPIVGWEDLFFENIEINYKLNNYRIVNEINRKLDTLTPWINFSFISADYNGIEIKKPGGGKYFYRYMSNSVIFEGINFNGVEESSIQNYNITVEKRMKRDLYGKAKRKAVKSLTKSMYDEINNTLINDMKQRMLSIEKFVLSPKEFN